MPEFQPKLEWLNSAPLRLKQVDMFLHKLLVGWVHVANLPTGLLEGFARQAGFTGFLDVLLHKLYAHST